MTLAFLAYPAGLATPLLLCYLEFLEYLVGRGRLKLNLVYLAALSGLNFLAFPVCLEALANPLHPLGQDFLAYLEFPVGLATP